MGLHKLTFGILYFGRYPSVYILNNRGFFQNQVVHLLIVKNYETLRQINHKLHETMHDTNKAGAGKI